MSLPLILQKNIFFKACGFRKHLFLFHVELLVTPASSEITHRVETQPLSYPTASEQFVKVAEFDQHRSEEIALTVVSKLGAEFVTASSKL